MDQGAYTCEAINVKGRVLATPDCIVRIVSIPAPEPERRPPPPPPPPMPEQRTCPPLTMGQNCETCRPGAFHRNDKAPHGCLKCFCFGITDQCRSSDWFRTKVSTIKK